MLQKILSFKVFISNKINGIENNNELIKKSTEPKARNLLKF